MRSSASAIRRPSLPRRWRDGGCCEVFGFGEFFDVDAADLGQFVLEGGEFGAAGHVVGEFFEADVGAGGGEFHGAQAQDAEVVADHVGVVGVVGDEDDAQAAVAGGGDVLEDDAGLFDAEGCGGLVEDEDAGAEVDGAGDGHGLALAAGEGADGLVEVVQDDAHVAQFLVRGLPSSSRCPGGGRARGPWSSRSRGRSSATPASAARWRGPGRRWRCPCRGPRAGW